MAFSFVGEYPTLSAHASFRNMIEAALPGTQPATAGNYSTFFIADRNYIVESVSEIHGTAGSDGSAVTLDITKDTGTTAPAGGSSVLSSGTFNLKATANTLQTIAGVATGVGQLAVGDRLALKLTGTPTAVASLMVEVALRSIY